MEVVLLEHVENLGTVGETVRVKAGYARNYLLPRKLACPATKENLSYYRTLIEAKLKKLAKAKASADRQAQELSAVTLTFFRRSRDEGARLFGSVTTADIAHALEDNGFEIDKKQLSLPEPIKKLGEFKAFVSLHPEVRAQVTVVVKPEGEDEDGGGK